MGDASRAADTRSPDAKETPIDRGLGSDAVDSKSLVDSIADVGKTPDARDATGDLRDSAALRGPDGAEGGVSVLDARDAADGRDSIAQKDTKPDSTDDVPYGGAADTSYDMAKDTTKDTAVDTSKDTSKQDRPVIIGGPHGCASPIEISSKSAAHVDLSLTTIGANHEFDLPCGEGGPQLVLSFNVSKNELVYVDTFGANWNTMLYLSTTCPVGTATGTPVAGMIDCSDDACNTAQSQVFGHLASGTYYIVLGGANGESGDVTLHFQHAQAGSGALAGLPVGTGAVTGTTTQMMGSVDICEGPGGDNSYWWVTCPEDVGGTFTASTCNGTAFDSVLALQIPRTDTVSCNDDYEPCGSRSSISSIIPPGAGLNVMTIDGGGVSSAGSYRITYTRP